jgi:hypothetical protein
VAARCPRLGCICRTHGFAAEPTLGLLISNHLDLRPLVASTLVEVDFGHWSVLKPFEGLVFRALVLGRAGITLTC